MQGKVLKNVLWVWRINKSMLKVMNFQFLILKNTVVKASLAAQ